jgi:hypothetical protein
LFFEQCPNGCNADTELSRQILVSTARLVQFPDASGVLAGSHPRHWQALVELVANALAFG